MFLSKVQYDAVMAAMQSAEQPRELPLGPQQNPTEFAKLYNTLWVADRLVTAAGEEKWWYKIDAEPSPVQPSLPTVYEAIGMAGVLPTASMPPAFEPTTQLDVQWPRQDAASNEQRDNPAHSDSEARDSSELPRSRRLVDAMTGTRATAQTKEKITYNAYLKRRWVDSQTGNFVPPYAIGSVPRAEYEALIHVDPSSGVRVAADAPGAVRLEDAEIKLWWRSSRQRDVYRTQVTKETDSVKAARAQRRARAKKRAAPLQAGQ